LAQLVGRDQFGVVLAVPQGAESGVALVGDLHRVILAGVAGRVAGLDQDHGPYPVRVEQHGGRETLVVGRHHLVHHRGQVAGDGKGGGAWAARIGGRGDVPEVVAQRPRPRGRHQTAGAVVHAALFFGLVPGTGRVTTCHECTSLETAGP